MVEIRKHLYRNGSLRADWCNYRNSGDYFVTICTKFKMPHFGFIRNNKMCLSDEGAVAHTYWESIPDHFPFVQLGEFIVMPDHVHGIIFLDHDKNMDFPPIDQADQSLVHVKEKVFPREKIKVEASDLIETQEKSIISKRMATISPKKGSLASIIRSYKSAVTKACHLLNPDFSWQPLYYDHIIRNKEELNQISEYIWYNPERWR